MNTTVASIHATPRSGVVSLLALVLRGWCSYEWMWYGMIQVLHAPVSLLYFSHPKGWRDESGKVFRPPKTASHKKDRGDGGRNTDDLAVTISLFLLNGIVDIYL